MRHDPVGEQLQMLSDLAHCDAWRGEHQGEHLHGHLGDMASAGVTDLKNANICPLFVIIRVCASRSLFEQSASNQKRPVVSAVGNF